MSLRLRDRFARGCLDVAACARLALQRWPGEEQTADRLSDDEIAAVVDRIKRGKYLDDGLESRLFRRPKEYALSYAVKEPRGSVLARTMAVPFQVIKRYGGEGKGSRVNKLVFGDNLQVLKALLEMKERGELRNADGSPGVRHCYIDPPFASRREYSGSKRNARIKTRSPAWPGGADVLQAR